MFWWIYDREVWWGVGRRKGGGVSAGLIRVERVVGRIVYRGTWERDLG